MKNNIVPKEFSDYVRNLKIELARTEQKLLRIQKIAQAGAGNRMMQIAGPFREILNIINDK